MTLDRPSLTVFTNLALAVVGIACGYFFNQLIFAPILFTLGIPLVNMDRPVKQKIGFMLMILAGSLLVFYMAMIAIFRFSFDKYIIPGVLVGIAGVLLLLLNSLFIKSLHVTRRSLLLTFLLGGLSFPFWTGLNDTVFPTSIADDDFIYQVGGMLLWMLFTTIGITSGLDHATKGHKLGSDAHFDSSQLQGQLS